MVTTTVDSAMLMGMNSHDYDNEKTRNASQLPVGFHIEARHNRQISLMMIPL